MHGWRCLVGRTETRHSFSRLLESSPGRQNKAALPKGAWWGGGRPSQRSVGAGLLKDSAPTLLHFLHRQNSALGASISVDQNQF